MSSYSSCGEILVTIWRQWTPSSSGILTTFALYYIFYKARPKSAVTQRKIRYEYVDARFFLQRVSRPRKECLLCACTIFFLIFQSFLLLYYTIRLTVYIFYYCNLFDVSCTNTKRPNIISTFVKNVDGLWSWSFHSNFRIVSDLYMIL